MNKPLYEQLYEELKESILSNQLPKNTALSSVRIMAKELQVSRNTVDRAYQQLLAEGYIRSVPGSGYYVEDIAHDYFADEKAKEEREKNDALSRKAVKLKYDFKYSSSNAEIFPWNKWKKCVQNALLDESYQGTISYETNKGNLRLRECLCNFLNRHRGVVCDPEQVILCPGTQFAIEILADILSPHAYNLAFEEPGYDAMRNLFLKKGYSFTTIPVLEDGIDDELLSATNCNLLYMTPSHQFPTGVVTSVKKRNRILKWAYEKEAYIIENDYDSEFRHGEIPIPSFQSLDHSQRVIYIGTLSKVMLPSIRCAYIILPKQLLPKYDEFYKDFNSALPSYHQMALCHFLEEGSLDKLIRRMSKLNEIKFDMLVGEIKKNLRNYVEIPKQPSGVHTLVRIPECKDQEELLAYLRKCAIGIYGTKQYYYNKKNAREDMFLVGFNSMSEEEIRKGCKRFGDALHGYFMEKSIVKKRKKEREVSIWENQSCCRGR